MAHPSVSVVVPTRNRRSLVAENAAAILAQDPVELIFVDDGSEDGTADLIRSLAADDPRLSVVDGGGNGVVAARLNGVRSAAGDVVLLLDDDVIGRPGLIDAHARLQEDGPGTVVLGYMPLDEGERRRTIPEDLYCKEYERHVGNWEDDPTSILPTLWAGNLSLHRSDYLALAPAISEIPSFYHEDADFGLCCDEAGLTGRFDRNALAVHRYSRDFTAFLRDAQRSAASLASLEERHPGTRLPPAEVPFAGLSRAQSATVRLAARHAGVRHGLRLGASISEATHQRRVGRRIGDVSWRAEQVRYLDS
ncbi:MAG TPA: glycosyltransferase [Solirubrobacterales bacterium]|jgi:glycosyltransferase involved in cell wall biosynthesis|nr:glycosyltransferase [Solirubrobacterales bacterium]